MKLKPRHVTLSLLIALACAILAFPFIPRARAYGLQSLALVGSRGVSDWSLDRLEAMGSEGAASLGLIALDHPDTDQRSSALMRLKVMGVSAAPATPALAEILAGEPDPSLRRTAAVVVAEIGPRASAASPELVRALKDEDSDVAARSRWALKRLGAAAVPSLSDALGNGAGFDESVARTLSEMWSDAAEAVPALTAALDSEEERVRYYAVVALGRIDPEAKSAEEALRRCLRDSSPEVRQAAFLALLTMGIDPESRAEK